MYEYEFIRIAVDRGWVSDYAPKEDYREIVSKYASSGWRLVQIFAPGLHGDGSAAYFEIIFERPVQRKN